MNASMQLHCRKIAAGVVAALMLSLGAGCSDNPQLGQATTYVQGKYQGKPDTRPYDNAPGAYSGGSQWSSGDRASWELALKRRQQGQNDYARAE